jgi:hypothetical protein
MELMQRLRIVDMTMVRILEVPSLEVPHNTRQTLLGSLEVRRRHCPATTAVLPRV